MRRILYRGLLQLHPAQFRTEFAPDMLWIFELETAAGRAWPLFLDALGSVGRQWLLRSGAWKAAAGALGGFVIVAGMLGMTGPALLGHGAVCGVPPEQFRGRWAGSVHLSGMAGLMEITLDRQGGAWRGEYHLRGPRGDSRSGPAEDIRVEGDTLRFRVKPAGTELTFVGRLSRHRLSGQLEPAGNLF